MHGFGEGKLRAFQAVCRKVDSIAGCVLEIRLAQIATRELRSPKLATRKRACREFAGLQTFLEGSTREIRLGEIHVGKAAVLQVAVLERIEGGRNPLCICQLIECDADECGFLEYAAGHFAEAEHGVDCRAADEATVSESASCERARVEGAHREDAFGECQVLECFMSTIEVLESLVLVAGVWHALPHGSISDFV